MTFSDFQKNIRTWIVNTLNVEVIYSHGKGPRPKGQYAVMNVVNIGKLIKDEISVTREVNGDIRADYKGIKKTMVSINIYRDDTMQLMTNLKSSLSTILTQDYFNALDIGIISPDGINHIPEQIGKDWENRSQCDFSFHYIPTVSSDADISEIKKVDITNKINAEVINVT